MKKIIFALIAMFSINVQAQDVITLNDIYQSPQEKILSQFVVEYPNKTASEIKTMVEQWSLKMFVNPNAVTVANTTESIVFKPILTGSYSAGMGVVMEVKVTCNTQIEFKDGKMRVTITEVPSTYVSSYGVSNRTMADMFTNGITEYKSKGMYAPNYRMLAQGKSLVNGYVVLPIPTAS